MRMPFERFERLGDVADGDRAAALEDDKGMLGGAMPVPRVDDAGLELDLRHRERGTAEVAALDQQPPPDPVRLDDAGRGPATDRCLGAAPAPFREAGRRVLGVAREQGEGVDRAVVADEVVLRRRLVQHVAGADRGPLLEPLAVLEGELARGDVDDRLDAVAVRPHLDAGRDAIELEADAHSMDGRSITGRVTSPIIGRVTGPITGPAAPGPRPDRRLGRRGPARPTLRGRGPCAAGSGSARRGCPSRRSSRGARTWARGTSPGTGSP